MNQPLNCLCPHRSTLSSCPSPWACSPQTISLSGLKMDGQNYVKQAYTRALKLNTFALGCSHLCGQRKTWWNNILLSQSSVIKIIKGMFGYLRGSVVFPCTREFYSLEGGRTLNFHDARENLIEKRYKWNFFLRVRLPSIVFHWKMKTKIHFPPFEACQTCPKANIIYLSQLCGFNFSAQFYLKQCSPHLYCLSSLLSLNNMHRQ